ncbi:nucleotide excision repair factor tfiih tfiik subunit cyclin h-like protein [Vairimorpha apis BRL 01]|uniref:Nucleotide excision repair factor tfiih tfiik subunit cyclin h-like protein n=1 Tax=Vairimorpha apis BRL 01 TaxID=1037528 RepID=T0MHX6_9MICR|nr:nucleotide excision repair factor tfiih tfiik subunit cyclin h-like protein [Vairimorpha apis BRL 01]
MNTLEIRKNLIKTSKHYNLPLQVQTTSIKILDKIYKNISLIIKDTKILKYVILVVASKCEDMHDFGMHLDRETVAQIIKYESLVHEMIGFEYVYKSAYTKLYAVLVIIQEKECLEKSVKMEMNVEESVNINSNIVNVNIDKNVDDNIEENVNINSNIVEKNVNVSGNIVNTNNIIEENIKNKTQTLNKNQIEKMWINGCAFIEKAICIFGTEFSDVEIVIASLEIPYKVFYKLNFEFDVSNVEKIRKMVREFNSEI